MNDPRPICPIPPDAKVGDIVVSKQGKFKITRIERYNDGLGVIVNSIIPGGFEWDGRAWFDHPERDCIAFEYADGRKPNLPHAGKPTRTQAQRDATYIRDRIHCWKVRPLSVCEEKRLLAIADRSEKQQ